MLVGSVTVFNVCGSLISFASLLFSAELWFFALYRVWFPTVSPAQSAWSLCPAELRHPFHVLCCDVSFALWWSVDGADVYNINSFLIATHEKQTCQRSRYWQNSLHFLAYSCHLAWDL